MKDFLMFNSFITPDVLIFFYYIGALGVPFLLWFWRDSLLKKFSFFREYRVLSKKERIVAFLVLISIFLSMELCWRMMFEMMIGYFDIHNYLYEISKQRS